MPKLMVEAWHQAGLSRGLESKCFPSLLVGQPHSTSSQVGSTTYKYEPKTKFLCKRRSVPKDSRPCSMYWTRSISMVSKPIFFEVFVINNLNGTNLKLRLSSIWFFWGRLQIFIFLKVKNGCIPKTSFLGYLKVA
jgi:hypothetical protein